MSEKDYLSKQDSVHKSKINMTKEISKQFKADQRRIFEDTLGCYPHGESAVLRYKARDSILICK